MTDPRAALERLGIDLSSYRLLIDGPPPIHGLTVPGASAIDLWSRLRSAVDQTGHWPILLGGENDLERHRNALEWSASEGVEQTIAFGESIDPRQWFKERQEDSAEASSGEAEEIELPSDSLDDWPDDQAPSHQFITPFDVLSRKPKPKVYLGLAPTRLSWHDPAYLRFGAWNACPGAEEHVAVMRYWNRRYGADIVAVTGDVIEMAVTRPPSDRQTAMDLAREQYVYCPDIVDQGVESVAALAAVLLNGSTWYFWWD